MKNVCCLAFFLLGLGLFFLSARNVQAHELSVASLDFQFLQGSDASISYTTKINSALGRNSFAVLPLACEAISKPIRRFDKEAGTQSDVQSISCDLRSGTDIALSVKSKLGESPNVLVRVQWADGSIARGLISEASPRFLIPPRPEMRSEAFAYFGLGWKHLVVSYDHLAFLLGLVCLIGWSRRLILMVTAFTLGHSMSLVFASSLGWSLMSFWVELGIASSIMFLGIEVLKPKAQRVSFGYWAVGFGFLHGLGFAGSLAELGWSSGDYWVSLAAFNLGIEAGQLAILAVVGAVIKLGSTLGLKNRFQAHQISYVLGGIGAYAFIRHLYQNFVLLI